LRAHLPSQLIVDSPNRDYDTATDVVRGLGGVSGVYLSSEPAIFSPQATGVCPPLGPAVASKAKLAQHAVVPPPANYTALLAELQAILGVGVAGPLASYPYAVVNGTVAGASYLAAGFAEAFLMQLGSEQPAVAWGRADAAAVARLQALVAYHRDLDVRVPALLRYEQANLLWHVGAELAAQAGGSAIFVGHDTSLDAAAVLLGLTWDAPPYGPGATPPGAVLRFTAAGEAAAGGGGVVAWGNVTASFHYPLLGTPTAGQLLEVPVRFADGVAALPLEVFVATIDAVVDKTCVQPAF
jgi:hypothetical protein